MTALDLAGILVVLGLIMIAVGLAAYDWRLAVVAVGGVLLGVGLWSALPDRGA